jgi:hypothetical protein
MRLERAVQVGDRFTSPDDAMLLSEARPAASTLPNALPSVPRN